jgi:hypothetical protein
MPPKLDPHHRAQVAAHIRLARSDPREMTVPARTAFAQQFLDQARAECPNCTDKEVERRAGHLRSAFQVRLSAAGVAGQRKKAGRPRAEDDPPGGGPR